MAIRRTSKSRRRTPCWSRRRCSPRPGQRREAGTECAGAMAIPAVLACRLRLGGTVWCLQQTQVGNKPKMADIARDQGVVALQGNRRNQRIREPEAVGKSIVVEQGDRA